MAVEVYHANTKKVLVRYERHPADIAPVFIATAQVAQLLHVPQVQRRGGIVTRGARPFTVRVRALISSRAGP